jgi:hypothetical protein
MTATRMAACAHMRTVRRTVLATFQVSSCEWVTGATITFGDASSGTAPRTTRPGAAFFGAHSLICRFIFSASFSCACIPPSLFHPDLRGCKIARKLGGRAYAPVALAERIVLAEHVGH